MRLRSRLWLRAIGVALLLVCALYWLFGTTDAGPGPRWAAGLAPWNLLGHGSIPASSNIVLVIKTGATEIEEKLPVHFDTTLKAWPKVVILADYADEVNGHTIHDALSNVSADIRERHIDFELWRRLHAHGRATLGADELSSNRYDNAKSKYGKNTNKGWRLARFMNLPMVQKTLELKPNADWYVFIDADTYISCPNTMRWLAKLDHRRPVYLGAAISLEGKIFAHGGSGYILSSTAMHAVAERYARNQQHWDDVASRTWAGDYVLGLALNETGISITRSNPLLQGGEPATMNFAEADKAGVVWCFPAASYHHVAPEWIARLHQLERGWLQEGRATRPMTHGDVFRSTIMPRLSTELLSAWDNGSEDGVGSDGLEDVQACRDACKAYGLCLQYVFSDGTCRTSRSVSLGSRATNAYHSGWMLDRISEFAGPLDASCSGESWVLP